jgi:hypothetical protein
VCVRVCACVSVVSMYGGVREISGRVGARMRERGCVSTDQYAYVWMNVGECVSGWGCVSERARESQV